MKLKGKSISKLAFVLMCVAVGVLLCIPWVGRIAQVFRGRSIESSGVFFTAPSRYLVHAEGEGQAWMWRSDFGVPLWPAAHGFIGIHRPHYGKKIEIPRDLDRLRTTLVDQEKLGGMNLDGQRSVNTDIGMSVCFQFKSTKRYSVSCFFDNSTLGVRYDGSEKFVGDVYELVASATSPK